MFSNLSLSINETPVNYPIHDSKLPFSEYIAKTRAIIEERRVDLNQSGNKASQIIEANAPFEFYPNQPIRSGNRLKYGALLIHGLLDCPFSLRDIGNQLQANGILSRAILLPGHGTTPSDLLRISYHDWIQAVRYGIESLHQEVENIFLVGYSTGAALSIYHASQDANIAGIILLSPAIKIKPPVDIAVAWHKLVQWVGREPWLCREKEIDYAKYQSIPFNAVSQVAALTRLIRELGTQHTLANPICMVTSREDETISSHKAMDFFCHLHNQDSRLLLYSSIDHRYPDSRIITRVINHPELRIKHCSHVSIPFAPNNVHYGVDGDYLYASHPNIKEHLYGAYNRVEARFFDSLFNLGLTRCRRRELTYNPDFNFMASEILKFISAT